MELKLLLLCYFVFQCVSAKDLSSGEINEELDSIHTEIFLFTGQSIIKEQLIVKEILELKRSIFLLKAKLNSTPKTERDIKNADSNNYGKTSNDSQLMDKLKALENKTKGLKSEIMGKDEAISKLDKQIHSLTFNLNKEKERRLLLEEQVKQLWAIMEIRKEL